MSVDKSFAYSIKIFSRICRGRSNGRPKSWKVAFSETDFSTVYCCCATTVHESHVFIALGLALSEKHIPQVIVNIEN